MKYRTHKGFTLFELLTVIAILAILMVAGLTNWKAQVQKGYDAERKGDLAKLKAVLEHYSIDHGCYPLESEMTSCSSTMFASYNMPTMVCDPESKQPYLYQLVDPANPCLGYRLYTILKLKKDPDIERLGCNRGDWCGVTDAKGVSDYNYGMSSGGPIVQTN